MSTAQSDQAVSPAPSDASLGRERDSVLHVTDRSGAHQKFEPVDGKSLMPQLRRLKVGIIGLCNGNAACGTCHVYVDSAWLGRLQAPDEFEEEMLEELDNRTENSRLSCQIVYEPELNGMELTVAPAE